MAESIHIIPQYPCDFLKTGFAMFSAISTASAIYRWKASDFVGFGGSMIVTSEAGGSKLLWYDGYMEWYKVTNFGANVGHHEGSAFVDCHVPCATCP
jgi:hypothetical protein